MSVKRERRRGRARKRVRVGAPDRSLTATSWVAALGEFITKLDVVGTFDRGIGYGSTPPAPTADVAAGPRTPSGPTRRRSLTAHERLSERSFARM